MFLSAKQSVQYYSFSDEMKKSADQQNLNQSLCTTDYQKSLFFTQLHRDRHINSIQLLVFAGQKTDQLLA